MQIICTSLQTYNHASTLLLSFYRPDALPATQPTASKHWRQAAAERPLKWMRRAASGTWCETGLWACSSERRGPSRWHCETGACCVAATSGWTASDASLPASNISNHSPTATNTTTTTTTTTVCVKKCFPNEDFVTHLKSLKYSNFEHMLVFCTYISSAVSLPSC